VHPQPSTIFVLGVFACAAAGLLAGAWAPPLFAKDDPATILNVETICTTDKDCRVKVTMGEGREREVVVTTFRANRVGPDMKYFKGEEYGSFDFPNAGLMYLDRPVVLDEEGMLRPPSPADSPENLLTFTTNVSVDPLGHVTFFYGFLHGSDGPIVHRSYLWGYPPTTVKTIGAIGGPRSPVVPREPPPPRVLKGGVALRFLVSCNPENACRVTVVLAREDKQGKAVTFFRANNLGEDMRYFPCEKEGGTELVAGGGTYFVDLDVLVDELGALRQPQDGDVPDDVGTLTSTVALDDRGHVTFFYGFVRDPDSSNVRRFYLWGYPPGTLMVDDPGEHGGSEEDDRSNSRTKRDL
jgi:hypothetical protein